MVFPPGIFPGIFADTLYGFGGWTSSTLML
jgi:hypothetical protein